MKWLLLGAIIASGLFALWALSNLFPGRLVSDLDRARFVNLIGFLVLVSAGVVAGRRFKRADTLRNIAIWIGIFALLIVGYAYRDVLEDAGSRIRAELIPSYAVSSGNHEMTLTASEGGSFYVMGTINGEKTLFLIDTGASDIVLSPADARRSGIDASNLVFTHNVETAHGLGSGASATIENLSVGPIELRDVLVSINGSPMRTSLLGLAFLRRLDGFEMRGDKLRLRWHG